MKKKKNIWETVASAISERDMNWDTSDEADPRGQKGRSPASPGPGIRTREMPGLPWRGDRKELPGLPPEKIHDPDELGMEMEDLSNLSRSDISRGLVPTKSIGATGQQNALAYQKYKHFDKAGWDQDSGHDARQGYTPQPQKLRNETDAPPGRRQRHDTIPLPTNYKSPGMIAQNAGNLRVDPSNPEVNAPEYSAQTPRRRQLMPTRQIPVQRPTEASTGASGAGFQMPIGDAEEAAKKTYREMVDEVFIETVRKLPNGKFGVYMKNKGKKHAAKKVGEYPDRVAAREAELARGGKSGEAAKKERDRLSRLKKDPKKLAAAKKDKGKKSTKKESIINSMVSGLSEALFREEDVPGSTWDERLAALSPTALASNKKLAGHTKNIQKASVNSLMQAQKDLAKALKRYGKLNHGDIGTETGGKMYLPCHLSGDEDDMGPIYLYIEGGNVKLEMDESMNETLDGMEDEGHGLRGALMAFSQKHLPRIDGAKLAVVARDKDLDKWEKEHDDELSGRDGLSLHLLKHLIGAKHGRRYR